MKTEILTVLDDPLYYTIAVAVIGLWAFAVGMFIGLCI
jgi:hypothetical protein